MKNPTAHRAHETTICEQVGHEWRPVAGGRVACVCCGVPAPEAVATAGTKRDTEAGR